MLAVLACLAAQAAPDPTWQAARANGEQARRAMTFCVRYASGWLAHADPTSGLLPRTLRGDWFWNARDCAADNFPFLALTAHLTGQPHLLAAAQHVFAQERRLTRSACGLPDDFVFADQALRRRTPPMAELVFGAAEYCKDGLLPLLEWTGDAGYRARLVELLAAIAEQASVASPAGALPAANLEVNGDLLQAYSRAAWLTGEARFAELAFRLGDHYLLHDPLLDDATLALRDHGCEVIGGLSEAYVLAAHRDPARRDRWRSPLHALLSCIAQHGVRADGLLHHAIDPRSGAAQGGASDGWGYVLDAFLAVAEVDAEPRWREVVAGCLSRVAGVDIGKTPGLGGADGAADTLEGALNLLARLPAGAAQAWVDREMERLLALQRPDGVIEGWYGDGNSARTAWMWALAKTCGVTVRPWRPDVALGAERLPGGGVRVALRAEFAWRGLVCFDRPRHRDVLHLPFDYARINQWPEWFTAGAEQRFAVTADAGAARPVRGDELWAWPAALAPGAELRLLVEPQAAAGGGR